MKWPLGRYANYLQLDVHTPSAVTASTTGIAVTQSVIELTAATAVALVRSRVRTAQPDQSRQNQFRRSPLLAALFTAA
jgi:hypothetical protein